MIHKIQDLTTFNTFLTSAVVPENLKTADICLEAVKQDGLALKYVPENLKTAEILFEMENRNQPDLEMTPWDDNEEFWKVATNEAGYRC